MDKICIRCGSPVDHYKELCNRCYHSKYYINNINIIKERVKKWQEKNPEKRRIASTKNRRKVGILPQSENRYCANFLGIHVAERVLSNVFENVVKQPHGNPGFDFICNKGMKIDVKSACLHYMASKNPNWNFRINYNKIADYFLCLAFDNRENLTPLHIWLIPSQNVNTQSGISTTTTSISKWDKYKLDINKVSTCCDIMKGDYV